MCRFPHRTVVAGRRHAVGRLVVGRLAVGGVRSVLRARAGEGGGAFPDIPGLPDLPDLPPGLGGLGGSTVSFSMNRHKMQIFNTQRNELQFGILLLDAGVQAPDVTLD